MTSGVLQKIFCNKILYNYSILPYFYSVIMFIAPNEIIKVKMFVCF